MDRTVSIDFVVSPPFAENTYIVGDLSLGRCIIVDPGFDPESVLDAVRKRGFVVEAIVNTHGHVDHIAGNEAMKNSFSNSPLMIGSGDAEMLSDPVKNLSQWAGLSVTSPPADRLLEHGEEVELLDRVWRIRQISGHSPGHIVFIGHDGETPIVLGGDVLFAGSIGRTDLPFGSTKNLIEGIKAHLLTLPDETIVYPGHGSKTTIGTERRSNPFLISGSVE